MSLVEKVARLDREQTRVTTIYEMIGRFGDRIPKDVRDEMYKEATESQKRIDNKLKKL